MYTYMYELCKGYVIIGGVNRKIGPFPSPSPGVGSWEQGVDTKPFDFSPPPHTPPIVHVDSTREEGGK
jgi:hypothetical protein